MNLILKVLLDDPVNGDRNVLIKGGHFDCRAKVNKKALDYLLLPMKRSFLKLNIDTSATHGTGCTLAAAIAANSGSGKDLKGSVDVAKKFVNQGNSHCTGESGGDTADHIQNQLTSD